MSKKKSYTLRKKEILGIIIKGFNQRKKKGLWTLNESPFLT